MQIRLNANGKSRTRLFRVVLLIYHTHTAHVNINSIISGSARHSFL